MSSTTIKAASFVIPFDSCFPLPVTPMGCYPLCIQVRDPLAVTEMLSGFAQHLTFFPRALTTLEFSFCPILRKLNV